MTIDMIFKNFKDLKINISGMEFNSLDSDRKKLTILNYNLFSIYVNNKEINLIQNIGKKSTEFFQYSLNLKDYKVIVQQKKELEPQQPDLHILMKNKKIYDEFYLEIKKLFKKAIIITIFIMGY
jgi:CHAT domain-containing protein